MIGAWRLLVLVVLAALRSSVMADWRVPAPRPKGDAHHLGLRIGHGGFAIALSAALALAGVRCFHDLVVEPSQPSLSFTVTPESTDVAIGDTVAPFGGTLTANGQPVSFRLRLDVTQGADVVRADSLARVAALARGVARLTARPLLSVFTSDTLRRTVIVRAIVPRLAVAATPSVDTLTSLGDTIDLRAVALTRAGDTIPGVPLVWRQLSGASSVQLLDSAAGRARAAANGLAEFLASVDTATARRQVRVVQVPVSVSAPDSARLTSLGQTVLLAAAVRDARGNDVAGAAATWTSLQPGVASVDPATGLVTAVANGTARVEARAGTLADTTQVTVSQVARKLAFTVEPRTTTAGQAIAPAVAVAAQDSLGHPAAGFADSVTVALGTNPGSGVMAGTTTVAAAAGVATFSSLSISVAATGYGLTATSGTLTGASSDAFDITPAAASQLSFAVQPTTSWAGEAISPAVRVAAHDALGNVATSFTGDVTVAIGTNPGSGSLSGTTTVAAVAGVATFNTLAIDKEAAGYTLTAGAPGLASATSAAFGVAARIAAVSVTPGGAALSGAGATQAFAAQARDALGNQLAGRTYTWASLNPNVATVNAWSGLVTAVASGQVTIAAMAEGVSGYALATVAVDAAAPNLLAFRATGTSQYLSDVWGTSSANVFAVGQNGTIRRWNGTTWAAEASGTTEHLRGVWGTSPANVFAVGTGGTVLKYDGTSWSSQASGTTQALASAWGTSPADVFAVGEGGAIVHFDGTRWTALASGTAAALTDVWGTSPTNVFVVGWSGTILRWDGTAWAAQASGTAQHLLRVWGTSPTNVYAAGTGGTILRYDGTVWAAMASGTTEPLCGLAGTSPANVVATGGNGTILRLDGSTWTAIPSGTTDSLESAWVSPGGDLWVTGSGGTVVRGYPGGAVAVAPASTTISTIGGTQQLTATARDAAGAVVNAVTFTWTSNNTDVATVTSGGVVTPVANGTATITATAPGGAVGAATVTVNLTEAQLAGRLSAGGRHTCGLGADGAANCWGENLHGQLGNGESANRRASPVHVQGDLVFKLISTGDSHTCGLTTDGAAYCWGENSYGQLGYGATGDQGNPIPVTGGLVFQALSAGPSHTCGLTAGGAAYCWGYNGSGQLGDGSTSDQWRPVAVSGGLVFRSISAGIQHTCGLTTDGAAYCWGYNGNGQLGDGTTGNHTSPMAVAGGLTFYALSAGDLHSCALTAGGAAYCWGSNVSGQLGDGTTAERWSPTAVSGGRVFQAVSAGPSHTCALTTGGAAYCWGRNPKGQLGDGTTSDRTSPVAVTGGVTLQTLSAGSSHTCGLTTSGTAYCWGDNSYDQLGLGAPIDRSSPVAVSGGLVFQEVRAGYGHSCGIITGGAAYCWGDNGLGGLGDGTSGGTSNRTSPVAVLGGLVFQAIRPGGNGHTCGLTAAGAAYCWGKNYEGQLGIGRWDYPASPVPVVGGLVFQALAAGFQHSCGVTAGGVAYCWGKDDVGQLGDGGATNQRTPVAVLGGLVFQSISSGFGEHNCALTTDGYAYCWGYNAYSQLGDGTTSNRSSPVSVLGGLVFQSIGTGVEHTCGLTSAGAAYCWGNGGNGQLGDGTGSNRTSPAAVSGGLVFQAISAGGWHNCGITTGGAAYCWGSNGFGQLGNGSTGLPNRWTPTAVGGGLTFKAISAGFFHTCGLTTSGAAYCWGSNGSGVLGDGTAFRTSPVAVTGGKVFGAPVVNPTATDVTGLRER